MNAKLIKNYAIKPTKKPIIRFFFNFFDEVTPNFFLFAQHGIYVERWIINFYFLRLHFIVTLRSISISNRFLQNVHSINADYPIRSTNVVKPNWNETHNHRRIRASFIDHSQPISYERKKILEYLVETEGKQLNDDDIRTEQF